MSVKRQCSLFAALASLISTTSALPSEYGYWNVNITSSSSATGYRFGSVDAEYSGAPGTISTASWLFNPQTSNWTYTYVPTTFKASQVNNYNGAQPLTIWQNLTFDGTTLPPQGSGTVALKCGGVTGRMCTTSTVVNAALSE